MPTSSIALIDNAGPNSVKAAFKRLCVTASSATIHVAFTMSSGLAALLPSIQRVATKGRVQILTGLYHGFTEPKALRTLLGARRQSKGSIEVKLSRETNFHRKAYVAATATTMHAIVGSSNLTDNGLLSGGELSLWLRVPTKSPKAEELRSVFDKAWRNATTLTDGMIDEYEKRRVVPKVAGPSKGKLAAILGKASHEKATDDEASLAAPRYWTDGIFGYAKDATSQVISSETSWDKYGWAWQSCGASVFRPDDCIVLIDKSSKPTWASVVRVRDTAGPISTPDGRHFVAYTQIPRTRRRQLTKAMRTKLRSAGVPTVDGSRRRVSTARWRAVLAQFQK